MPEDNALEQLPHPTQANQQEEDLPTVAPERAVPDGIDPNAVIGEGDYDDSPDRAYEEVRKAVQPEADEAKDDEPEDQESNAEATDEASQKTTEADPELIERSRRMLGQVSRWSKPDRDGKTKLDTLDENDLVREAVDSAKQALKRWQYPDEVINSLGESRLLEMGADAHRVQADQQRQHEELRRTRQAMEQIEAEKSASQTPSQHIGGQQPPQGGTMDQSRTPEGDPNSTGRRDESASLEPLLKTLQDDELLKDHAQPLVEAIKSTTERLNTGLSERDQKIDELRRELEKRDQETERIYRQMDNFYLDTARRDLQEQFPEMRDPESFGRVKQRVYALAQLPPENQRISGYRDDQGTVNWQKLVSDAATLEGFGSTSQQRIQDQIASRVRKQSQGQSQDLDESARDDTAQKRSLSPDEKLEEAARLMQQGFSTDEIREKLRKM